MTKQLCNCSWKKPTKCWLLTHVLYQCTLYNLGKILEEARTTCFCFTLDEDEDELLKFYKWNFKTSNYISFPTSAIQLQRHVLNSNTPNPWTWINFRNQLSNWKCNSWFHFRLLLLLLFTIIKYVRHSTQPILYIEGTSLKLQEQRKREKYIFISLLLS